jgi:hypothetical protein
MVRTATVTEMLAGVHKHRRQVHILVSELRDVGGKTHDHRKVRKHMNYRCSTSPGGIRVVDLYFPKGGTTTKLIE